jgi:glyoxylase-like metal-dependent hydrolase (beta-lactamase superfamily II)
MKFILYLLFLASVSAYSYANTEQLKIIKLADNVYQHVSYKVIEPWGKVAASGLVVVDGNNAHIIDTPWGEKPTKELIDWIRTKGFSIKSSVVTHFHDDASGGMPLLNKANIKTYATAKTNALLHLENKAQSSHEIPSNSFELVKNTIEIFYPGNGHTEDNIVVWLAQHKILFGGCFVKSLHSKNLGNTADASIEVWPASIQNVLNKYPDIETVVPGHGKIGNVNLLKYTAKLALEAKNL